MNPKVRIISWIFLLLIKNFIKYFLKEWYNLKCPEDISSCVLKIFTTQAAANPEELKLNACQIVRKGFSRKLFAVLRSSCFF
jgi:hypothetical protein